jgi:hypothetical protein
MDGAVQSSAVRCARRAFAIAATTIQPKPAKAACGRAAPVGKETFDLRHQGGGVVTPRSVFGLLATYTGTQSMRMSAGFWDPPSEGRRD